jgi:hypothetical protein
VSLRVFFVRRFIRSFKTAAHIPEKLPMDYELGFFLRRTSLKAGQACLRDKYKRQPRRGHHQQQR